MTRLRSFASMIVLLFAASTQSALGEEALASLARAAANGSTEPGDFAHDVNVEVLRLLQHPPTDDDLSAVPALAETFAASDPHIQDDILRLFAHLISAGENQQVIIIETAIEALKSPAVAVRVEALSVLGRSADPAVLPNILEMLYDLDWDVRYQALHSLVPFAEAGTHPEIFPLISHLANDENERVRMSASSLMRLAPLP